MERKAAQRDKVNEQARQRRAVKKEAERFQSPAFVVACEEAERKAQREAFARRERLAWAKKAFRKAQTGPYVDGLKLMIERRSKEYAQKRKNQPDDLAYPDNNQNAKLALKIAIQNSDFQKALETIRKIHQQNPRLPNEFS